MCKCCPAKVAPSARWLPSTMGDAEAVGQDPRPVPSLSPVNRRSYSWASGRMSCRSFVCWPRHNRQAGRNGLRIPTADADDAEMLTFGMVTVPLPVTVTVTIKDMQKSRKAERSVKQRVKPAFIYPCYWKWRFRQTESSHSLLYSLSLSFSLSLRTQLGCP